MLLPDVAPHGNSNGSHAEPNRHISTTLDNFNRWQNAPYFFRVRHCKDVHAQIS